MLREGERERERYVLATNFFGVMIMLMLMMMVIMRLLSNTRCVCVCDANGDEELCGGDVDGGEVCCLSYRKREGKLLKLMQ